MSNICGQMEVEWKNRPAVSRQVDKAPIWARSRFAAKFKWGICQSIVRAISTVNETVKYTKASTFVTKKDSWSVPSPRWLAQNCPSTPYTRIPTMHTSEKQLPTSGISTLGPVALIAEQQPASLRVNPCMPRSRAMAQQASAGVPQGSSIR